MREGITHFKGEVFPANSGYNLSQVETGTMPALMDMGSEVWLISSSLIGGLLHIKVNYDAKVLNHAAHCGLLCLRLLMRRSA